MNSVYVFRSHSFLFIYSHIHDKLQLSYSIQCTSDVNELFSNKFLEQLQLLDIYTDMYSICKSVNTKDIFQSFRWILLKKNSNLQIGRYLPIFYRYLYQVCIGNTVWYCRYIMYINITYIGTYISIEQLLALLNFRKGIGEHIHISILLPLSFPISSKS